jgi:hypothetical protein
MSADGFAKLFVNYVYSNHGLPDTMVTDRGSIFTSRCWRSIAKLLNIDHKYSTAYHPQTDGQTEIVNQWLEQYIRMYTAFDQSDWVELLRMAEFCYNATRHSTTGMSTLRALTGIEPRRSMVQPPESIDEESLSEVATQRVRALNNNHEYLMRAIRAAQESHKRFYDKHRREPSVMVGGKVYVKSKHYRTIRPSHKLEHRNYGPFTVLRKINKNAYEIHLPESFRAHKVLPVSVLTNARGTSTDAVPTQAISQTPEAFTGVIESIHGFSKKFVDKKLINCVLVHWQGFGTEDRTWEPLSSVSRDPMWGMWQQRYNDESRLTQSTTDKRTRKPSQRLRETL